VIVLDTHAWVWWASEPERLSAPARRVVEEAAREDGLLVSSISVWEVAMLVARGRLELTLDVADWVAKSEALPFLVFVPVSNAIASRSVRLPGEFHEDPADRIIVATAVTMGARVVSKDAKIRAYPHVEVVW
jgi:PIN domain nuclease of toxin-antitoxin system